MFSLLLYFLSVNYVPILMFLFYVIFFHPHQRILFPLILFLKKVEGREDMGKERNIIMRDTEISCLPQAPWPGLGIEPHALDWKWNPQLFVLLASALTTGETSQGLFYVLSNKPEVLTVFGKYLIYAIIFTTCKFHITHVLTAMWIIFW